MAASDGAPELLIGMDGRDFVSNKLAELAPNQAVREIQSRAGLQHPLCVPLLGLADQLSITRHDAHRGVLVAARLALLSKVQQMTETDKVKLERLLNASFKYLGIQELREVPVAVMEKLEKVGAWCAHGHMHSHGMAPYMPCIHMCRYHLCS